MAKSMDVGWCENPINMLVNCIPEAHPPDKVAKKVHRLCVLPRLGPPHEGLEDLRAEGGEVGVVVRVAEGEEVDWPQRTDRRG